MTLVVPNLLVTLPIIICPIVRRAACSLRVDTPIFEATPVTHDLYCWENAADEPHPPLSRSDLVQWHNSDLAQCPLSVRYQMLSGLWPPDMLSLCRWHGGCFRVAQVISLKA